MKKILSCILRNMAVDPKNLGSALICDIKVAFPESLKIMRWIFARSNICHTVFYYKDYQGWDPSMAKKPRCSTSSTFSFSFFFVDQVNCNYGYKNTAWVLKYCHVFWEIQILSRIQFLVIFSCGGGPKSRVFMQKPFLCVG